MTMLLVFVGLRYCAVQEPAGGSFGNQSFSNGLMRQAQSISGVMESVWYPPVTYSLTMLLY